MEAASDAARRKEPAAVHEQRVAALRHEGTDTVDAIGRTESSVRDLADHSAQLLSQAEALAKASNDAEGHRRVEIPRIKCVPPCAALQPLRPRATAPAALSPPFSRQLLSTPNRPARPPARPPAHALRRHAISLYVNISNIRWDYETDLVAGVVAPPNGGAVKHFSLNPAVRGWICFATRGLPRGV